MCLASYFHYLIWRPPCSPTGHQSFQCQYLMFRQALPSVARPHLIWRPPALPHRLQCSTIGRLRLNRRVRDGNGCFPQAHRHQKYWSILSCYPWINSTVKHILTFYFIFLRKEVIQPHLPIRLPCYDFTPVIGPAFGSSFFAVRSLTSGVTDSHGVTGGVYKTRERIHRGILIRDY